MEITIKRKGMVSITSLKNTFYVDYDRGEQYTLKQSGTFKKGFTFKYITPLEKCIYEIQEVRLDKKGVTFAFGVIRKKDEKLLGTILRMNDKASFGIKDVVKDVAGGSLSNIITEGVVGAIHGKLIGWTYVSNVEREFSWWLMPKSKKLLKRLLPGKWGDQYELLFKDELKSIVKTTLSPVYCKASFELSDDLSTMDKDIAILLISVASAIESRQT